MALMAGAQPTLNPGSSQASLWDAESKRKKKKQPEERKLNVRDGFGSWYSLLRGDLFWHTHLLMGT